VRRPRATILTRTRLLLTAWYAGLFVVLIGGLGAGVYFLMTDRLDAQVTSALEDDVRVAAPRLGELVDAAGDDTARPVVRLDLPDQQEASDDPLGELAEHGRFPSYQLLLDASGRVLESTLGPAGVSVDDAVTAARGGAADARTLRTEGTRVRVLTAPVTLEGEPIGFVQAFRSLAERDETAADLLRVVAVIGGLGVVAALAGGYWLSGRALDPIRLNLEAQQRFVADASHELRTPVSVVRTSAELLLRHPERRIEDERALVTGIVEEAGRMGTVISDLLDLTRVEQMPAARRRCDLSALAADALAGLREPAVQASVVLESDLAPGVEVEGDAGALIQVVRALVDNAIRHGGRGTHVQVSVAADGAAALLTVADDGPGIARTDQERIFERFARVDTAQSREAGGTGLGLAIVRAAVARHGGDLAVHSAPGRGARFTVRLPRSGTRTRHRSAPP
jgi:two-component system sensor histidine kinase CiaH